MTMRRMIITAWTCGAVLGQIASAQAAFPAAESTKALAISADTQAGERVATTASRKCGTTGMATCKRQHAPPNPKPKKPHKTMAPT
ncbi:MAG: hypothetical protein WBQ45_04575 [Roseiarcus sp.]|jgi:hypothetical protein|uniref:hypothetical protein n=1 Tax=Roseiarcus sp. TaxID=1969460 RepID=UPI003BB01334